MPTGDAKDPSSSSRPGSAALLSYQTRLLENPSLSRTSSLSRSNSQTAGILAPNGTRRWTQSHRSTTSVDSVRDRSKRTSVEVGSEQNHATPSTPSRSFAESIPSTSTSSSSSFPRELDSNRDFASLRSPREITSVADVRLKHVVRDSDKPSATVSPTSTGTFQRSPLPPLYTPSPPPPAPASSSPTRPAARHNSSASIDSVRGRWEERVRESESAVPPSSPTKVNPKATSFEDVSLRRSPERLISSSRALPSPPSPSKVDFGTPTALKRRTMPSTMTPTSSIRDQWEQRVKVDDFARPSSLRGKSPERPRTPSSDAPLSSPTRHRQGIPSFDGTLRSPPKPSTSSPSLNDSPSRSSSSLRHMDFPSSASLKSSSIPDVKELGDFAVFSPASPTRQGSIRDHDVFGSTRGSRSNSFDSPPLNGLNRSPSMTTPDPMNPSPYRSPSVRKQTQYSALGSGRLGNHLPRIASGDGEEEAAKTPLQERSTRKLEIRAAPSTPLTPKTPMTPQTSSPIRSHHRYEPKSTPVKAPLDSPLRGDFSVPAVTADADAVTGKPDRIRLARRDPRSSLANSPLPTPSGRLARGLWADTQRHLIQAYEYLCHVGEAQQWIEGCLDEELGFGVVEMEEAMRNGVVLAKLARVWEGAKVVRKIFEHEKLQYRHSDNINIFLDFVRRVGLPESFIFELTDLYNKKNIPKVIYCIHALAHLLSRRGMAQRIGNLLGHLEFSDDQLQKTQKGLNDAGVAMPNFGGVGRELAKEINEEPEEDPETDEERRDRLLLECESSIIQAQAHFRGVLARKQVEGQLQRLHLRERYFVKFQARCRGVLARRQIDQARSQRADLRPFAVALQSSIRGILTRRKWYDHVRQIEKVEYSFVKLQAQARGYLERRRFKGLKGALRSSKFSVVRLQAFARAKISRHTHTQAVKVLQQPFMQVSWLALQAQVRGILVRRRIGTLLGRLDDQEPSIVGFQSQARAALVRWRVRGQLKRLDDARDVITQIQAACRALLARRRLLGLIRALRQAVPAVTSFQAIARARLRRQEHVAVNKALAQTTVVRAVGGLQTLARAALTRQRLKEQSRQLDFVMPDVVGIQSACRGALVRDIFGAWRDHLRNSHAEATYLQALIRGATQRKAYREKLAYYQANLQKVVKIQSLFRAKEQREQYRQLTMASNVTVGTIKNFVHLLDDSEADFEEEIALERLRKRIVEVIRENQALETEVAELDVKIALVVQNVKSFEELIKARRQRGDSSATISGRNHVLAAHGDPFSGSSSLDHGTKRRLELYQQLFYLLQTKSDYFARLFFHFTRSEVPEKTLRMTERVVLTIFGYGQDRREDYLLLQLLKMAIYEEIDCAPSIPAVVKGNPFYSSVIVHYVRPRQVAYVRDALQIVIQDMLEQEELDLETDPLLIYRACINEEEMQTGIQSRKPKEVTFDEAVKDPETRLRFIHNVRALQVLVDVFLKVIIASTRKMPYGMRFVAHAILEALKARFPNQPPVVYATAIGHFIFDKYLFPAITNPETFDIFNGTISPRAKKNLGAIAKVLAQIAGGEPFGDRDPAHQSINSYVLEAIPTFTNWFLEVAEVEDAESHFQAHEFLDAAVQPKPIYISPNEVYAMHSLLAQHVNILASPRDDPLRLILTELNGVPNLGSEELKDARDKAVTLELTNRFADVRDPRANEKAIWVQAKRGVLAVLRVQPATDLVESLVAPVTEEHEDLWDEVVNTEIVHSQMQEQSRRQPSTGVTESAYRLEDIRTLSYADVKEHALYYLLELEKLGKVSRSDGYQGILNAIAADLRSKHRRRIHRRQEMDAMNEAVRHLKERRATYKEQIASYNNYIDSAMSTMQRGKGKKRFVMPFTKQFFHQRELQRSGKNPQFGSYIYSAQELYDKGILLSIDQFSPRQFDRIDVVLESNEIGIFTIKVTNTMNGVTTEVATQELRMEDLLQANFEGRVSLPLFEGMAKVNLNLLLFQINKKFYV